MKKLTLNQSPTLSQRMKLIVTPALSLALATLATIPAVAASSAELRPGFFVHYTALKNERNQRTIPIDEEFRFRVRKTIPSNRSSFFEPLPDHFVVLELTKLRGNRSRELEIRVAHEREASLLSKLLADSRIEFHIDTQSTDDREGPPSFGGSVIEGMYVPTSRLWIKAKGSEGAPGEKSIAASEWLAKGGSVDILELLEKSPETAAPKPPALSTASTPSMP